MNKKNLKGLFVGYDWGNGVHLKGKTSQGLRRLIYLYKEVRTMFIQKKLSIVEGIASLKLKFSTRSILVKLFDLIDDEGKVIIDRSRLAVMCNVSGETVGRAIKQLKQLELVEVNQRYSINDQGQNSRSANEIVVSTHRVELAIKIRTLEIKSELNRLAA